MPTEASPQQVPTPAIPMSLQQHDIIMNRLHEGAITVEQFQAGWTSLIASKQALLETLSGLKKDQLLSRMSATRAARYKSEKKADCVEAVFMDLMNGYRLSSWLQVSMGGDMLSAYERTLARQVAETTPELLADFAKQVAAERAAHAERLAGMRQALENPQTLEDFRTLIRIKGEEALTEAQVDQYDQLQAEDSLARLRANEQKRLAELATARAAAQTVGAQVIPAKHTKHGYEIFVVQLADRVERHVYDDLNAQARKLGGWYSSYRGNGAIPGFTFKKNDAAQAFAALVSTGDTQPATQIASERRNAFEDDKSQSTIERLRAMADQLEARGNESMGRDRKANTARRVEDAAAAERAAAADIALVKTMRKIADAIEADKAPFLGGLRTKTQVELFTRYARLAHIERARKLAKDPNGAGYLQAFYEQLVDEPVTEADARVVKYPLFRAYRGDLANLGRELAEIDGAKQLGAALLKVADDMSEEYVNFVKANATTVGLRLMNGELAQFASREQAETARRRSPARQKMVVIALGRGKNLVALSPQEAIERKLWTGSADTLMAISAQTALEVIEKVSAINARKVSNDRKIHYPYTFDTVKADRHRLASMGLETGAMLRAAMREFIGLQEAAPKADRVRELMRALVGKSGIGIDFFPTAKTTAAQVVAEAGIEPGMDVLEPSAGYGAIADEIREAGVEPDVCEISSTLREVLDAKGYNVVAHDFIQYTGKKYDRIIMNPPFSKGLDIQHVHHAYSMLKPGGRIVAIMSEGAFYRSDRQAEAFRGWVDGLDGSSEKLPEGSFLDPSLPATTGVNARVVVIDHELTAQAHAVYKAHETSAAEAPELESAPSYDDSFTGFPSMSMS
jgi:hypothetical protein